VLDSKSGSQHGANAALKWFWSIGMLILHVHVHVKPEHIEAFRQASIENAKQSRKEAGVARFDVIQQADDPSRFVLVEVYRSKDGHAQHRETAHYHAWVEKVTDMMAEPRTRATYENVYPDDREW
jgi:(4S)-4-hydroxy-5-phosphonooxypentane-2,3-dione isomerase